MIARVKQVSGWILLAVGFLILLLPGPLGWPGLPVMAAGAILILSTSLAARRWFVQAAREEPKMFGRLRGWLRERQRRRSESSRRPG